MDAEERSSQGARNAGEAAAGTGEVEREKRPYDETRRMLKVFGVKVTDYEERSARLLEEATSGATVEELHRIALELAELSADMSTRLREMNDHVLEMQARVLSGLKAALQTPAE